VPTHSYDLIVLGDELPGLVAAALCARRGLRVLLATVGEPRESYQLGPYTLPIRPAPLVGLRSPAVKRVVEDLNIGQRLTRRLRDTDPAFQFIGPGTRIDVAEDDDRLAGEVEREISAPAAARVVAGVRRAAAVSDVLEPVLGQDIALPPATFWERREIARSEQLLHAAADGFGDDLDAEPLCRALLDAAAALGTALHPSAQSSVTRARTLDLWRQGTARLPGGRAELRAILTEKLCAHGGEVRTVVAEAILCSWGRATGVRLREGEELGAEHILAAMPVAALCDLLDRRAPRRLVQGKDRITPAAYRYTLNLVMSEAGVPEGMAATALVVTDANASLVGANALALYVEEPDDEARVVVTVEALCPPPENGAALADSLADLRVRVRERLEDLMPFSHGHVLVCHSPHESAPPEGADGEGLAAPGVVAEPAPVWRCDLPATLGVSALGYSTGIKRLTFAGNQILPGLGLEGDLAVGWCAARLASAGSKRKDYLKDEVIGQR
jgi:hypothetical protein